MQTNAALDKKHCFYLANLRICDSRINHYKFAVMRFADWQIRNFRTFDCGMSPRNCKFAVCGLIKKICVPTFGTKEHFSAHSTEHLAASKLDFNRAGDISASSNSVYSIS
jgi:hypothetical protein